MVHSPLMRQRPQRTLLAASFAFLLMLLLSACNGTPQIQQRANQNKVDLDNIIAHARSIGIPETLLKPIISQENSLSQTSAPIAFFSSQPVDMYNTNLAKRYNSLVVQVQGLETQTTQQYTYQASVDMQSFENMLGQRRTQGFTETSTFAKQLQNDQTLMAKGQYPNQFLQIMQNATDATQALHLLGSTYDEYASLQKAVQQLKTSGLDTTSLNLQLQSDLQSFRTAKDAADFTQLEQQLNAQTQAVITLSAQSIPYVGAAKLKEFSSDITMMKQAGINTTKYQQMYNADQAALTNATSLNDYLKFSTQLDSDIASTRVPMLQAQAQDLVQQYHQKVQIWGNTHQWTDSYNGQTYRLDYEYDQNGIGSDLDSALESAQTPDDYQGVIDLANSDTFNLKLMETDYSDQTAWNQPHTTDLQALQHYGVTADQVIVVSLIEQSLRLYQNGQLVKSFQITSGQYDKPSLPGFWNIIDRESPTVFKSDEPKGSAFWYPDTKINYAMGYHSGGYFLHDSWWRNDYGPHTNFPHYDSGGDESFAGSGSHGCINMQEQQAGWLYANTSYSTEVIIY